MDLRLPICIELEISIINPRLEASAEAYLASEDTDRYAWVLTVKAALNNKVTGYAFTFAA